MASTAPRKKYEFKNGLDSDVKAKMMEDSLYDSWDLAQLIAACKIAEKGLKVSKKSYMAAAAEVLDSVASLHSVAGNEPWQHVRHNPRNRLPSLPRLSNLAWKTANGLMPV